MCSKFKQIKNFYLNMFIINNVYSIIIQNALMKVVFLITIKCPIFHNT